MGSTMTLRYYKSLHPIYITKLPIYKQLPIDPWMERWCWPWVFLFARSICNLIEMQSLAMYFLFDNKVKRRTWPIVKIDFWAYLMIWLYIIVNLTTRITNNLEVFYNCKLYLDYKSIEKDHDLTWGKRVLCRFPQNISFIK